MTTAKNTIIAYASKGGATEQAAQAIANVLSDKYKLNVELVNLRKGSPNISPYQNVVVGAGVRGGKVYNEALNFLKQDFGNRKVAFFVCCGGAGDPKNYEKSCALYVTEILRNYPNVKTLATEAFGGYMKVLGKTVFNNLDIEKVRAWAENLGTKFIE